ncbi:MAG: FecR domain-containing protein [Acidobacteriota bacterium]
MLDDTTAEIRSEKLDAAVVGGAAQRVWTRLAGEQAAAETGITPVDQIRSCADFQSLIPAYLQGSLSSARTMLLEDHTRECVPCRKALKDARYGNQSPQQLESQKAKAAAASYRMTVVRWAIAAMLVVGVGVFAWPYVQRFTNSVSTLSTIVEASGNVYKVADSRTQTVKLGDQILRGEHVRTAKNAGAVVKLADGSLIEMRERSEFSVTDNGAGTTINLERGQVIVQAAKQRERKLFVATGDSLVSVTGTIFSVNSGTKGARVSVIEGEVHVGHSGQDNVLHAGQQISTHESVDRIPVREEIAWSRDANRYAKMLDEVRAQIDQQVAMPGNRYSTRLLDLAPENTVIYVALPNISETLAKANDILQQNLQQNPELREWWANEQSKTKGRKGLDDTINLVREFGGYLGDEIVLAVTAGANGQPEEPVILAELKDGAAFRSFLEGQLAKFDAEKKHLRIVDNPAAVNAGGKDEFYISITQDLLVASPKLDSFKRATGRAQAPNAKAFAATPFYNQIAGLYRDGAGLLIAADLEKMVMQSLKADKDSVAVQQLGLTDLRYFIVEMKEKDGKPYNRAVVNFKENQHGVTSWLAQPGPMGALEFISPDANVVAAFVVKEPTALVDDLLNTLKATDPHAWEQLQQFQQEQGIDLRRDIATPLGGEYAFAVDGPVLPIPSWKAVFEVDDPQHLQETLERTISKLNEALTREGKKGFAWTRTDSNGRTFYTLKSLDLGLVEATYAYAYGYLIAAPSRALVENAIKYKESGFSLVQSAKFKATLPEDKQANFSAMVYQNVSSLTGPMAKIVRNSGAPKEAREMMQGVLGKKAGLAYVYALPDRMVLSVNTEDGALSLSPADLLGLPGSSGVGHILKQATR